MKKKKKKIFPCACLPPPNSPRTSNFLAHLSYPLGFSTRVGNRDQISVKGITASLRNRRGGASYAGAALWDNTICHTYKNRNTHTTIVATDSVTLLSHPAILLSSLTFGSLF